MIIFYADSGFELNLTDLKITFVEENALFYDAFFKNYTLPFSLPVDEEMAIKLGLINEENISGYTVKHEGKIFIDNSFETAYLIAEMLEDDIEASLSFGKITIPLMDTLLSKLPFPLINPASISDWATSIKNKFYPEVSHAFPIIFDDEYKKESNYEAFEGLVNNVDGAGFITNSIDVDGNVLNKNIITPFPYLMEILKLGFSSANLQMIGDFTNVKANNHVILDPKKHLEKFSSTTYDNYQFSQTTDEYLDGSTLILSYSKTHTISTIGSFNIKAFLNFPREVKVRSLVIKRDTTEVFRSNSISVDETITINKEDINPTEVITVTLEIEDTAINVATFNNFEFEKEEGKLNIFRNSFSLSEFMPEMTFGALLAKVKNWQNLKIVLSDTSVRIDYIENVFTKATFKNEKAFEIKSPKREFNQAKLYKLKYSDTNFILIDKNGITNSVSSFREEDIISIDMDLQILPVENRGALFSAVRTNDDVFSLLLYNGQDVNGYSVATDKAEGLTFLLPEVYNQRWKNWLHFRINSETITDKFTAHSLEEFLINEGRFKYNKKHIYKTIKRTRQSEEKWNYEIESETF